MPSRIKSLKSALLVCFLSFPLHVLGASSDELDANATLPDLDKVIVSHGTAHKREIEKNSRTKVLVWNIHKAKDSNLMPDLREFADKSDILLLQESITGSEMVGFFEEADGVAWHTAISFFRGNGEGTGVTAGTRFEATSIDFIRSAVREPFTNTPKMIVLITVPIAGSQEQLLVANIHGINFVGTRKFGKQIDQLIDAIKTHAGPLLVAGDFNTRNHGRMSYLNKAAKKLNLTLVPLENDDRDSPLDHIYTRGLRINRAELVGGVTSSDHFPLILDFSVY